MGQEANLHIDQRETQRTVPLGTFNFVSQFSQKPWDAVSFACVFDQEYLRVDYVIKEGVCYASAIFGSLVIAEKVVWSENLLVATLAQLSKH